jgi:hypothetical protein
VSEREAPKIVTCKEAADLLRTSKSAVVEFRPKDVFVTIGKYKDSDPAYVWSE